MEWYFARPPLINYVGAGLWIAAPIIIVLLALGAITRNFGLGAIIVGVLLLIGSVPAAFMAELSINGCCGAPSTGYVGMGYVIGIVIAMVGIGIIIFGKKLAKKKSVK